MVKVHLELPERFLFETELSLRAAEMNYAGHLGNDTLLSLLQEVRIRFLAHYELKEMNMFGLGLVITDSMAVYESEAFRGERLKFEVTVADFNKYGCDFVFRVTEATSGRAVARAKTGMVFFDYEQRKVQPVPAPFRSLFEKAIP